MHTFKVANGLLPLMLFVFISALLPGLDAHPDIHFWERWSTHIFRQGLKQAYFSGTNYPPLYQYILWIYGKMQGSEDAILAHIKYLRSITLLFDFIALWIAYKWMNEQYDYNFILLTCILNIAFSYNTVIWFQVDGITSAIIIAACYLAWKQQVLFSAIAMLLALNFKLQSFIFLPLWGLLILYALVTKANAGRKILMVIAVGCVLQYLILYPFIQTEESIKALKAVLFESVDRNPYLSWWGYNLWYWVAEDPTKAPDNVIAFAGICYKHLGMLLFFTASFFALLPAFFNVVNNIRKRGNTLLPKKEIWLGAALISLSFFFFNTQMHERYCHSAFLFIILYAYYYKDIFPLIQFSLAYFLNLEGVLHWLKFTNYDTVIFAPKFVAAIHALCIFYLFLRLYSKPKDLHDPQLTITCVISSPPSPSAVVAFYLLILLLP